jgi:uncharacterized protein (UPF0335 family)
MVTLQEIRSAIDLESQGRLSLEQIQSTLDKIECFAKEYNYLPNDIDDWYEDMSQYVYDYEMAMDNIGGDWEG